MYNRKNIIQGQTDVPLSSLGERQAELVAHRLKNERFTHIFSSDLSRAYETAKIICNTNRVCRCEITLDTKLRERKFGSAEGKTSKELHIAAKRAKKRYIDFTPPGAETVLEVQERVRSFFKEICSMCVKLAEFDDQEYTPARIKRRNGGSLGRNSRHGKRLQMSGRSQSFCGSGNVNNIINEFKLVSDSEDEPEHDENENFCKHSNLLSMQESDSFGSTCKAIEEYSYRECFPSSSDDSNLSSGDLKSNGSFKSDSISHSEIDRLSSSTSSMDHNGAESDSTLSDSVTPRIEDFSDHKHETQKFNNGNTLKSQQLHVEECLSPGFRAGTDTYFCPNISLSPSSHRLSSISSISSGRNSSFDDTDGLPSTLADILVVSHGGFIKETVRYFVESLDCKIPGVKSHALKVCPNCSISRFTVSIEEGAIKPSLTCVTIHDKDHLLGLDMPSAKGEY